jgi:hypothetical protein
MAGTVHFLSFKVFVVDQVDSSPEEDGTGQPYRVLEARPMVDGVPLLEGYVFDIAPLIGYGLRDVDTDLYTCGCGVAGCAGIHEHVQLRADRSLMTWTFPEEPFRKELAAGMFPAEAPLTLRFAKKQYRQALKLVEAEMLALAADGGAPVVLAAGSAYPDLRTPLKKVLKSVRKRANKWLASVAREKQLFGELLDQEVLVNFPNGALRIIPVTNFAYHLAYEEEERTGVARDDLLGDTYLPGWKRDTASLIAAVRATNWDLIREVMFRTSRGGDEIEPVPEQWTDALFTLEQSLA